MTSIAGDPYANVMVSDKFEEHAALVALLRAQPDGLSWPEIAAELLDAGSAIKVWERHAPAPALISPTRRDHTWFGSRGHPVVAGAWLSAALDPG
jgi:hypothetical protein